jgi:16S rRNA (cytidine1402-2'-O)-methyltransferase
VDPQLSTSPNPSGDDLGPADDVGDGAGPGESPGAVPAAQGGGPGRIVLAATPIGNVGDATYRLIELLTTADIVAAEDTRRLHRLVQNLGVTVAGRIISYHEHNEAAKTGELLDQVRAGKTLVMVTDAGMPSVSDPGFRLVEGAVAAGLTVTAAPGPSAVLTALALSGLPTDRFCFEGFLPRKAGERSRRLAELAEEARTMVFFEAPHRTEAALVAMAGALGEDRPAAVCRELTKTHEEVVRGGLGELARWASGGVRGEVTLVVSGRTGPAVVPSGPEEVAALVAAEEATGTPRKEAIRAVARRSGVPKREVYDAVHRDRPGQTGDGTDL